MADWEDLADEAFINLETYGLAGGVPGVKDIKKMRNLLSVGGVLLFIPYLDDASTSYIKDPSILDANNNSVYSDGYVQRPGEAKFKTYIPKQIDLIAYAKLYATFRTIYRSSEVADVGDIVLNQLFNFLSTDRGDTPLFPISTAFQDLLLNFITILQKGFTVEQFKNKETDTLKERSEASSAALVNNVALYKEFQDSKANIYSKYTTLYTSFTADKLQDTISIFSEGKNPLRNVGKQSTSTAVSAGGVVAGVSALRAIEGSTREAVENILTVPSEFFELFYELVMLMYKYSNLPLPIHLPRKGWCYGTDTRVDFHHSSKAFNLTLVDIDLSLQEVMSSSFINLEAVADRPTGSIQKPEPVAGNPAKEIKKKETEVRDLAKGANAIDKSFEMTEDTFDTLRPPNGIT